MKKETPITAGVTLQMSVRVSVADAIILMKNLAENEEHFTIGPLALPTGFVERAKWLLNYEITRRALPDINLVLGDPTWTILLDLFVRDAENKLTSITSTTIGTCLPATTALRHLDLLTSKGYVKRASHPTDDRTVLVSLTTSGRNHITNLLANLS